MLQTSNNAQHANEITSLSGSPGIIDFIAPTKMLSNRTSHFFLVFLIKAMIVGVKKSGIRAKRKSEKASSVKSNVIPFQ